MDLSGDTNIQSVTTFPCLGAFHGLSERLLVQKSLESCVSSSKPPSDFSCSFSGWFFTSPVLQNIVRVFLISASEPFPELQKPAQCFLKVGMEMWETVNPLKGRPQLIGDRSLWTNFSAIYLLVRQFREALSTLM